MKEKTEYTRQFITPLFLIFVFVIETDIIFSTMLISKMITVSGFIRRIKYI